MGYKLRKPEAAERFYNVGGLFGNTRDELSTHPRRGSEPVAYIAQGTKGEPSLVVVGLWEGRGEPQYEIMAPESYYFTESDTHTLICFSRQDVEQRLRDAEVAPCSTHRCSSNQH